LGVHRGCIIIYLNVNETKQTASFTKKSAVNKPRAILTHVHFTEDHRVHSTNKLHDYHSIPLHSLAAFRWTLRAFLHRSS